MQREEITKYTIIFKFTDLLDLIYWFSFPGHWNQCPQKNDFRKHRHVHNTNIQMKTKKRSVSNQSPHYQHFCDAITCQNCKLTLQALKSFSFIRFKTLEELDVLQLKFRAPHFVIALLFLLLWTFMRCVTIKWRPVGQTSGSCFR